LVSTGPSDEAIPGESFTFGKLISAQADGDFAALAARKRRVLQIQLGNDYMKSLKQLETMLQRLGSTHERKV